MRRQLLRQQQPGTSKSLEPSLTLPPHHRAEATLQSQNIEPKKNLKQKPQNTYVAVLAALGKHSCSTAGMVCSS